MRQGSFKIGLGLTPFFHHSGEAIKPAESIELFRMADLGLLQRAAQDCERFIIGLQRDREGMAIFSAMRK